VRANELYVNSTTQHSQAHRKLLINNHPLLRKVQINVPPSEELGVEHPKQLAFIQSAMDLTQNKGKKYDWQGLFLAPEGEGPPVPEN